MCIDLQRKLRSTISFISKKKCILGECVWGGRVYMSAGVSRGQKRTLNPL